MEYGLADVSSLPIQALPPSCETQLRAGRLSSADESLEIPSLSADRAYRKVCTSVSSRKRGEEERRGARRRNVRNLRFAASRGLEATDFLKDRGIVKVDSDDSEIRFGSFRFFLDSRHTIPANLRDAKALGVGYFLQQNLSALLLLLEVFDGVADVVLY